MVTRESPANDWLPLVPAPPSQLANPDFVAGIDGWTANVTAARTPA